MQFIFYIQYIKKNSNCQLTNNLCKKILFFTVLNLYFYFFNINICTYPFERHEAICFNVASFFDTRNRAISL